MGKALIIPGADFSANGIQPEFTRLAWNGTPIQPNVYTNSGIFFANKDVNNPYDELEFCLTIDSEKIQDDSEWSSGFRSLGSGYNIQTNCYIWFGKTFCAFYFGGTNKQSSSYSYSSLSDGSRHTFVINRYGGKIDDDSTTFAFDSPVDLSEYNPAAMTSGRIYLDARSLVNQGSDYLHATAEDAVKIHWVKYRRNGVLILDAIPVRRNSDGKIGFYDFVNDEYHFRNNDSVPVYGL